MKAKGRAAGHHVGVSNLNEVVLLLPTPKSTDWKDQVNRYGKRTPPENAARRGRALGEEMLQLLPTPCVADADGTRATRGGARSGELLLTGIARQVAVQLDWGKYEAAVRRWECVSGRPAPCPVEQGPSGKNRLSPLFTEWMMGLPPGWVTGIPGLSRAQQLRLLGNGVVPQQAVRALRSLLRGFP